MVRVAEHRGRTPVWAMLLIVLCTLLLSSGQLLLKLGSKSVAASTFLNPYVIAGVLLYGVAGLLMTFALKHGELSVLYPLIALGFIWVSIVSIVYLGESPRHFQLLGTALVIFGVSVIGHRGRE